MKKSTVYIIMSIAILITSGIFGYMFYTQNNLLSVPIKSVVDQNAPPAFKQMIYGGFGEEALNKAMDVAQVGQFLYVTDTKNFRVQVFDIGGTPLYKFGGEGTGPGKFKFPYGITGDSKGNVYVADLYNGGISIHDSKGKFIKYFAEKDPSEKTIDAPGGIRIVDDKLYVTDIQKSKVTVFDLTGKKLMDIGKPGMKNGEFRAPNAVTVDKDGNVYVVDTGNQRVQVFNKAGKFLRVFNGSPNGTGNSVFVNPRGIDIDSRGIIYVVSNLTNYIYGFDKDGKQVFVFGGEGDGNDKFSLPNGLYIDDNDQLYITDTTNQRVAVYQ